MAACEFTDRDNRTSGALFKLYPREFRFREDCGDLRPTSNTVKGIPPPLWRFYPEHPNWPPAYFDGDGVRDPEPGRVRKPLFSREGASIARREDGPITKDTSRFLPHIIPD